MQVTFYGVRGSTPCSSPTLARYGGNTSCVVVESPDERPVMFDLGTGARCYGATLGASAPFSGAVLLSHLHWDHVQGLPFFAPLLRPGADVDIFGPVQDDGQTVAQAFAIMMRPPYFPISIADLPGSVRFHDQGEGWFRLAGYEVLCRTIPHVGVTNGYRLERDGCSIAYLSDHQQPVDGSFRFASGAVELCENVDLMIHDAQYTPDEFDQKRTWGHCTIEYAVALAHRCRAKRLALFHHDPGHDDDRLDELIACAASFGERVGIEVFGARDSMALTL